MNGPLEEIIMQVLLWGVTAILGWVVGRLTSLAKQDRTEYNALKNGVKALLRSDLMHTHHMAVNNGFASTTDKEIMERTYSAYHELGGNGVATNFYNEMMALPTKEDKA